MESGRQSGLDAEVAWQKPIRPCVLVHATQKKQRRKGLPRKGLELLVSTEIRACPVLVPLATSAQEEAQLFGQSISVILKGFHYLTHTHTESSDPEHGLCEKKRSPISRYKLPTLFFI